MTTTYFVPNSIIDWFFVAKSGFFLLLMFLMILLAISANRMSKITHLSAEEKAAASKDKRNYFISAFVFILLAAATYSGVIFL